MNNPPKQLSVPRYLLPAAYLLIIFAIATAILRSPYERALISDWIGREGTSLLLWWVIVTLAGAAAFPILFRLMPGLPDRGYALARSAGLMLTGFVFWFLASLGFLTNQPGSIVLAWILVAACASVIWFYRRNPQDPVLRTWFTEHRTLIIMVEIVFFSLFLGWAIFRAHEPEIRSTEKPMEIMFINAIRGSETFPPNDGWLANYSISYYYFGYVIIAGLADLSGLNTGIAFGLASPLLFALAGSGILGVVYNLVRARGKAENTTSGSELSGINAGMAALVFLLLMGNFGTLLIELPWRGFLPQVASSSYFDFMNVEERSNLAVNLAENDGEQLWYIPSEDRTLSPGETLPDDYIPVRDINNNGVEDWSEANADLRQSPDTWNYWWWFRYSRVITDRFLDGKSIGVQPIAEFPQFSFVLSDIHPHVLALPFAVLAIGLGIGLALSGKDPEWWGMILLAIWVGGMIFMNSWDAVYIPFLIGAEGLRRLMNRGTGRLMWQDWWRIGRFAVIIIATTGILYLPWIISFTSQAGGFYLNVIWPTAPQQLFIHFGAFFLILAPFLMLEIYHWRSSANWPKVVLSILAVFIILAVVLPFLAAGFYQVACGIGDGSSRLSVETCRARDILFGGIHPGTRSDFWNLLFDRRLPSYLSEGLIIVALVLIIRRLFSAAGNQQIHPATGAALLVMGAGLVLILTPDFVYLIDNFRVRINTVFKLYYQGWIFFSIAAGYATAYILTGVGTSGKDESNPHVSPYLMAYRAGFAGLLVVVIAAGLMYTYLAIPARAVKESGRRSAASDYDLCLQGDNETCTATPALTLDGRPTSVARDEYAVIKCFEELDPPPDSIIAEAPCNCGYNMTYGRVATLTGVPTLLGWINHEGQWRGPTYDTATEVVRAPGGAVADSRERQVDRLYQSDDILTAQAVIQRYNIDYIMVGVAEMERYREYPDGLEKFERWLAPACQSGNITLYQVSE